MWPGKGDRCAVPGRRLPLSRIPGRGRSSPRRLSKSAGRSRRKCESKMPMAAGGSRPGPGESWCGKRRLFVAIRVGRAYSGSLPCQRWERHFFVFDLGSAVSPPDGCMRHGAGVCFNGRVHASGWLARRSSPPLVEIGPPILDVARQFFGDVNRSHAARVKAALSAPYFGMR